MGKLPTSPMRIVRTPDTSEVAAATAARLGTSPPPRNWPAESATVPRMRGLRMTMYAIEKKVATPPRTSRPTVELRVEISKTRSRRPPFEERADADVLGGGCELTGPW